MSPSALHHYFKAVAAMSPVQYRSDCGCRRLGAAFFLTLPARKRSPTRLGTRARRSSIPNTFGCLVSLRDETPSACVRQRLAEVGAPEPHVVRPVVTLQRKTCF
jgi:hypothetical protein